MSVVKEGVFECDGLSLPYAEAGTGNTVIMFPAEAGVRFDEVAEALASHYRVFVIDVPSGAEKGQVLADQLAESLARIGISSFSVVGVARGATLALAQAVHSPESIRRLVLVSPSLAAVQQTELASELGKVTTPTLVLVGTRDRSGSRDAGHICRERIPACYLVLVYEAGYAPLTDRREACLAPIHEFLEQGEGFIVSHDSQIVHP